PRGRQPDDLRGSGASRTVRRGSPAPSRIFQHRRMGVSPHCVAVRQGPFRWLLIGDSFGVSSGVRDGSTLASQLALRTGERTYNAAAGDPLPLDDIRFTTRRLGMSDGVVVFEYSERRPMAAVEPVCRFRLFADWPAAPARRW